DCRQAAGGSGQDPRRPRHQGEGGCLRPVSGHQHAGGIFRLHPQGSAALVYGREGNRNEVRLSGRTDHQAVLAASRSILRIAASSGPLLPRAARIGMLAIAGAAAQGTADSYPNRAVRIIVPFPAGGPTDILTRVIAQRLSEVWGHPVVIENQPGANTAIAA